MGKILIFVVFLLVGTVFIVGYAPIAAVLSLIGVNFLSWLFAVKFIFLTLFIFGFFASSAIRWMSLAALISYAILIG